MTIGIRIDGRSLNRCESHRYQLKRGLQAYVIAAAVFMLIVGALVSSMRGVDPSGMLSAFGDESSYVTPYAFYVTGTIVVSTNEAAAYESAARHAFGGSGSITVEVCVNQTGGAACVTVSAVVAPNGHQAAQAVRRIKTALGSRSRVAVCLSGYTNESVGIESFGIAAEELVMRLTRWFDASVDVKTAVRENGEVYLGMPWIPVTY
ncbi:hypothetical protein FACS1894184_00560 [Clostridia bacterium]|nr:hypothetical protein FACS1894184_00560 [Clostridia bacterium]